MKKKTKMILEEFYQSISENVIDTSNTTNEISNILSQSNIQFDINDDTDNIWNIKIIDIDESFSITYYPDSQHINFVLKADSVSFARKNMKSKKAKTINTIMKHLLSTIDNVLSPNESPKPPTSTPKTKTTKKRINTPKVDIDDLQSELVRALKRLKDSKYADFSYDTLKINKGIEFDVRYYGDWESEIDDDDDWPTLSKQTSKNIYKIVTDLNKKYKNEYEIDWQAGEKEYVTFTIVKK